MEIKDLTFEELANCRIIARKESSICNRPVSFHEVALREINKYLQGVSSVIHPRVNPDTDNIGKFIYLEFENGDCKRVKLVESSSSVNPDINIISTSSPIGNLIKNAKKNDIYIFNKTHIRVVDICKSEISATM